MPIRSKPQHIEYIAVNSVSFSPNSVPQRTAFQEYDDREFATGRAAGGLSLDWTEGLEPGDGRQYVCARRRGTLPDHRIRERQRITDCRRFPAGGAGKRP